MASNIASGAAAASLPIDGGVEALFQELLLPTAQFTLKHDSEWYRRLISGFNAAYAAGHRVFLAIIISLLVILSPFIGVFAAFYVYLAAIFRRAAVVVGRSLSDNLGYGEYVRMRTAYAAWKRAMMPSRAVVHPPAGMLPPSRFPALFEDELGLLGGGAAGAAPSWVTGPVRLYNRLFSGG
jgi:hypothetical protein